VGIKRKSKRLLPAIAYYLGSFAPSLVRTSASFGGLSKANPGTRYCWLGSSGRDGNFSPKATQQATRSVWARHRARKAQVSFSAGRAGWLALAAPGKTTVTWYHGLSCPGGSPGHTTRLSNLQEHPAYQARVAAFENLLSPLTGKLPIPPEWPAPSPKANVFNIPPIFLHLAHPGARWQW
jgi:hypothetical protein